MRIGREVWQVPLGMLCQRVARIVNFENFHRLSYYQGFADELTCRCILIIAGAF